MSAETPLGRVTSDGTVSGTANALRARGVRICSWETLSDAPPPPPLDLPDATVAEALDALVARHPGYAWSASPPLVRVAPVSSPLDAPTPALAVDAEPLGAVLDRLGVGLSLFGGLGDPDGPRVTLALGPADLGAVLDAAVTGLGRAVWHVAGRPSANALSITEVGA